MAVQAAGTFTANRKAIGLRAMTAGPLFLGLATSSRIVDGRVEIAEVTDRAYERQPVVMGDPTIRDGAESTNTNRVDFPAWADDSPLPLRAWFLTAQPFGQGEIVAHGDLEPREMVNGTPVWTRPRQGEGPQFLPGDIVLTLRDPDGGG